jgi:tRNA pseudouridine38-40 synthase
VTRWKFTIEYKGAGYAGWQRQDALPSIQQSIEEAIFKFCQQDIRLYVAGRTDAGVHARGQVAHADIALKKEMSGHEIAKAINAHLRPQSIAVIKAEIVPDDFHARFHAVNKLYHYRIISRSAFLTIDDGLAWQINRPLDAAAMHYAAQVLIGQHDFSAFRDSNCQAKSPVKTMRKIDVTARDYDGVGGWEIIIAAQSQSFLHHQMRNITGTLIKVGKGEWNAADVKKILESRDRASAGPTAPPEGLYLMRIDY